MNLSDLGWNDFFGQAFEKYRASGWQAVRVTAEHKELYAVVGVEGEAPAEVSGKLRHQAISRADFPAVGDWVAAAVRPGEQRATIMAVLPRQTSFSRRAVLAGGPKYGPGKTDEQVLAANVDTVFLVSGLDADFNPRRIERFLSVAWDSGASPVIVLNKADICADVDACLDQIEPLALGTPIHAVSAAADQGLEVLRAHLAPGRTVALLGSSGVGKSTIINWLLGEERLDTGGVRLDDSRGRHTTTHRELILLPGGGLVVDTPGMREIQMWGDEAALGKSFADVEQLMAKCRFSDCGHDSEPGCAITAALADGRLDSARYSNYLKLQKEAFNLALRKDQKAARQVARERDQYYRRFHKDRKEMKKKGLL